MASRTALCPSLRGAHVGIWEVMSMASGSDSEAEGTVPKASITCADEGVGQEEVIVMGKWEKTVTTGAAGMEVLQKRLS